MERKKTSLLIIGVCALVLSIIGVTYAFWQLRLSQTDEDVITSSCFDITMENEKDAILLEKAYPISDKEGESLKPFTFTIKNNCKANAKYQINLESLIKLNSGEDVTEKLDEKYLKVKLNEVGKEGSIQELTESNSVSPTIIEGQTEGNARSDKAYKLTIGYLEPEKEKQYELRLWLDGDLTMEDTEAMNKTYASKITVIATYAKEAKKSLVDTILAEQTKADDSGESGLYKVAHNDADITYTEDSYYQERLKQDEYRYAGKNPNNYVAVGDKYTTDTYAFYSQYTHAFDSNEKCNADHSEYMKYLEESGESVDLTECTSKLNTEEAYLLEYKYSVEEDYVASELFENLEICQSTKDEYESYGRVIVQDCTQPESIYSYTETYHSTEYASEDECISDHEGYEGICKISHHVGDPKASWRIIGLVNTPEGQRVKIIKNESIGEYSYDSSSNKVNGSWGVNEWSEADVMKLLNPGYDLNKLESQNGEIQTEEYANNSLYWNKQEGLCYTYMGNRTSPCDFRNNGMPENLKNMIDTVTWNTGSNDVVGSIDENIKDINANKF